MSKEDSWGSRVSQQAARQMEVAQAWDRAVLGFSSGVNMCGVFVRRTQWDGVFKSPLGSMRCYYWWVPPGFSTELPGKSCRHLACFLTCRMGRAVLCLHGACGKHLGLLRGNGNPGQRSRLGRCLHVAYFPRQVLAAFYRPGSI